VKDLNWHWKHVNVYFDERDGLHKAKVTVPAKSGGTTRRQRAGKTEKAVRDKLRKLQQEVEQTGRARLGRSPTVEQWFTHWIGEVFDGRPRTRRDYESRCKVWIFPEIGNIPIDQLEPEDIDRLKKAMSRAKKSDGHIRKTLAVVSAALATAKERHKVHHNVATMVKKPPPAPPSHESLTDEEAEAILRVASGRRNGARWFVALAIGPRPSETLGLRWCDLDLDKGTVSIEWQLHRPDVWQHGCDDPHTCGAAPRRHNPAGLHRFDPCPKDCRRHVRKCPPPCPRDCVGHARSCPQRRGGGLQFTRPKTWDADPHPRHISLPGEVVKMLIKHRTKQKEERLAAGSWWQDHNLVFCRRDGRGISNESDNDEWATILKEAGLPPRRVHGLRHAAATALLEAGVDAMIVQRILGHADIRTTRGYLNIGVEHTRDAADRMDGRFKKWSA